MGALFNDSATIQDDNCVSEPYGGEAMGDDQSGAPTGEFGNGFDQGGFGMSIES